jgi:hypothetical protein
MNFLYLDFETNKAGELFLVGFSTGNEVNQVILHEDLAPLAQANKRLRYCNPKEFIVQMVYDLTQSDRVLVAYSTAEKQILLSFCQENGLRFGATIGYLNLRKCAKRWINQFYREKFSALPDFRKGIAPHQRRAMKNTLASIMRLTSYQAPSDYAPGRTTARINSIRKGLAAKKNDYSLLTSVQKQKATKLLKHNCFDVRALIVLREAIARDSLKYCDGGMDEIVL